MENNFQLEAEVRDKVGSRAAVILRDQGRLPAIVYGHQQDPVPISLNAHDFVRGLHHGHRLMNVKVGSDVQPVLVKDVQYDHLGRDIVHVDLIRVDVAERIKVSVALELKGTAKGTHEGGMIEEHVDSLDIEAVVSALPDSIAVQVKDVGVGDSIHAGDIELPEGITLVSPKDTLVVTCHLKASAKSDEEAEGELGVDEATSPEVITEKKADDEG